ncbi:hypothetical protein GCM10011320_35780 [Neoroseomonas lacus]|uniref:Secreted protein n=1 Tax=Neoroseomonas lacus TaxID=287609 RepID=A0A917KR06_9PROT|nr:hypothetical protein GCM10011320_35780 [Neoroseomonas lacus]
MIVRGLLFGAISVASVVLITPQAQAQSAFCQRGSAPMLSDDSDAQIQEVARNCRPGDIIQIPPGGRGGTRAVARLCDFSKEMPIAGGMLFCVMIAPRQMR